MKDYELVPFDFDLSTRSGRTYRCVRLRLGLWGEDQYDLGAIQYHPWDQDWFYVIDRVVDLEEDTYATLALSETSQDFRYDSMRVELQSLYYDIVPASPKSAITEELYF